MDPGGISPLGPDERDGQEDVKEMGTAGQSGLSQGHKKRIKEMNGTIAMFKFSLEASLSIKGIQQQLGSWFKSLNSGKRIQVKNCLLHSESLKCQDSILCLQVEEWINKQKAALQSLANLVGFPRKQTKVPSLALAVPQEVLQEKISSPQLLPPSCHSPVFTFRDFIPLKITPNFYFPLLRLKLNLTDTGIRSRG